MNLLNIAKTKTARKANVKPKLIGVLFSLDIALMPETIAVNEKAYRTDNAPIFIDIRSHWDILLLKKRTIRFF